MHHAVAVAVVDGAAVIVVVMKVTVAVATSIMKVVVMPDMVVMVAMYVVEELTVGEVAEITNKGVALLKGNFTREASRTTMLVAVMTLRRR